MNPKHFRIFVVRPTLEAMEMHSRSAEDLLMGTVATESGFSALDQITGPDDETLGPAYGFYQIEAATHLDLYTNFLKFRPEFETRLSRFIAPNPNWNIQLVTNLYYATAVARMIYFRRPEALPAVGDIDGYADYYKAFFNTVAGKGSAEKFKIDWYGHGVGE